MAQIDVFIDRKLRNQRQFLIDDGNACFFAVMDALILLHFSMKKDVSFIGSIGPYAGEHFHQGGFTGTIFSHKAVDLSTLYFEIHIIQGFYPREDFGDVFHFQNIICLKSSFHIFPLLCLRMPGKGQSLSRSRIS